MERQILHVVVPAFPIALARVKDAALRERPVAVAAGNSERALLQCVSPEAESEGIAAGTPAFRARRICPSLIIIPPDPLLLSKGNTALVEASAEFTPVVEPAAGRVFLDLTASRRLFGHARDVAARLEKGIAARLGLMAMAGSGGNKLVSRIAADALPEPGVYDVYPGAEESFIAPFPVSVLPGIGSERELRLFRDLNLRQVHEIAALTVPQLRLAVGPFAPLLHERARGVDRSAVMPPQRTTDVVEEAFLEEEDNDDAILLAELYRLAESCGARLRRMQKGTRKLSLRIAYADGVTEEGALTLPSPKWMDVSLFAAAENLFHSVCRRRVRVKGMRLICGGVADERGQLELFATTEESAPQQVALQETLDAMRGKFGRDAIRWGRTVAQREEPERTEEPASAAADFAEFRYHTLTTRGG